MLCFFLKYFSFYLPILNQFYDTDKSDSLSAEEFAQFYAHKMEVPAVSEEHLRIAEYNVSIQPTKGQMQFAAFAKIIEKSLESLV